MNHCNTDLGTVERVKVSLSSSFRWKIENFSKINVEIGSFLLSPIFETADSNVKWHLKLYPNGKTNDEGEYISISVYYCSEIETEASYQLSIANNDNGTLENCTIQKELTLSTDFESNSEAWIPYRFHPMFVKRSIVEDPTNGVLVDDCLIILFEVILFDPLMPQRSENDELKDKRLKEFDDFEMLLDNEQFSDVTIVAGDRKIQGHKAILAIRSSVFEEYFANDVENNNQKTIVEISDLKYAVVMELFRFLYTGTANNVYNMADDLFVAADKYCVRGLKWFCENTLSGCLEVCNALEIFKIADRRRAKRLKERAIQFIVERADEIVERNEFASLRPDLMREIIRAMARKKVNTGINQHVL